MRVIPTFEDELKTIDPRLSIVINPNRPQLANIKLDGADVCPIPAYEIRDDFDPTYTIELPNGMVRPHRSRTEAIAFVNSTLERIKNPQEADVFFGRNGY
jgi:hypothetical protein